MRKTKLYTFLRPYHGVIRVTIILLLTNTFWKNTMRGDEAGRVLTFLGLNLTSLFNGATHLVAQLAYWLLDLFTNRVVLFQNSLIFDNGHSINVVWGCNGLKQLFIYTCMILFSRGPFLHKLWFLTLGLIVIFFMNVGRVALLAYIMEQHETYFELFHSYVLKYLFYGCLFMFWVVWEECVLPCVSKHTEPLVA